MTHNKTIEDFLTFINSSPTAWHAVEKVQERLNAIGFEELSEEDSWRIRPGKPYYVIRNGSTLCAFITPEQQPQKALLIASHTDSPGFKLKPRVEIRKAEMILLGTEIYGSPLLSSWLNRDLGIAGRVIYADPQGKIQQTLVQLDQYPVIIPQLAIHLDREVNEKGLLLNKQEHFNALAALSTKETSGEPYLDALLREKIEFKDLLGADLFLYPLDHARTMGYQKQMISSYRLDNLASLHAALSAFETSKRPHQTDLKMMICWDNEEIGSQTSHGAGSPFLMEILERILISYGQTREDLFRLIRRSLCLSIDVAHALHPNYIEKHDAQHQLILGKGVVIKTNAQHRYASDAATIAPLQALAKSNHIPLQYFASRNDIPCGTTIGPIHATLSGMPTVDIGCGILSMHSCRELISSQDHLSMIQLISAILK